MEEEQLLPKEEWKKEGQAEKQENEQKQAEEQQELPEEQEEQLTKVTLTYARLMTTTRLWAHKELKLCRACGRGCCSCSPKANATLLPLPPLPSPPLPPLQPAPLTLVAFLLRIPRSSCFFFYLFYLTFLLCECAAVCVQVCVCWCVCLPATIVQAVAAAAAATVAGENPKVPRDSAKC